MDTSLQNPQGNQGPQTRTKTKKVIEHVKLDAEKILDIKLSVPKELREAFVIAVMLPGGIAEQYTVHRPIGITDLNDDDWVMTRTSELRYLLARSDDPAQKEIDKALAKARTDYLIAEKLLFLDKENKILYPPTVCGGVERNAVFDEADARLKDAKHFHKTEHDNAQLGKPKAAVYHGFNGKRDDYLDVEALNHEKAIREKLKGEPFQKIVESIKKKQTFRTRGGPNEDKPQVKSAYLPAGKITQASDSISKLLARIAIQPPEPNNGKKENTARDSTAASTVTAGSEAAASDTPKKDKKKG